MQQEFITVTFNRTKIAIRCADILYVIMSDDYCTIHMFDESVYRCRMTLKELKKQLNEGFMEVKRGCMIAVSAISEIGDKILLSNGEEICYTKRKKRALREELQKKQELMIAKISKEKLPLTPEEYGKYYKICDALPFAFTDIEMVFDKERIYEKIGGYDAEGDSRVVTELIRRIRKKMKMYSEHEYIATVWGRGYKWAK